MTRSNAREIAVHLIYAAEYTGERIEEILRQRLEETYLSRLAEECDLYAEQPGKKQVTYIQSLAAGVVERQEELNEAIARYAIGWKLGRISRLPRIIMQVAIYEALYVEDVPVNVAINEAVKLTRKYEEEETVSFVNGILGAFARSLPQAVPAAGEPAAEECQR